MSKTYKIWLELEELDEKGDTTERSSDLAPPQEVEKFEGQGALRKALTRLNELAARMRPEPPDSPADAG